MFTDPQVKALSNKLSAKRRDLSLVLRKRRALTDLD